MEKVLAAIDQMVKVLTEFKLVIIAANKEIIASNDRIKYTRDSQEALKVDLDKRTIEIKKVEDVVKLQITVEALLSQNNKEKQILAKNQQDFNNLIVSERKKISEGEARNKQAFEHNEKESEALTKLREELENEKKNYKNKIMAEIKTKVS